MNVKNFYYFMNSMHNNGVMHGDIELFCIELKHDPRDLSPKSAIILKETWHKHMKSLARSLP